MLEITFKDGSSSNWKSGNFTDYEYMKDIFVVKYNVQWVGIYNMSEIKSIVCYEEECANPGSENA